MSGLAIKSLNKSSFASCPLGLDIKPLCLISLIKLSL